MWKIETPELPTYDANELNSAGVIASGGNSTFAPAIELGANVLSTINIVPDTPFQINEDGTEIYKIPIPSDLGNFSNVRTNTTNKPFTPATSIETIKPGEYYTNPYTNELFVADKNNAYLPEDLRSLNVEYIPQKIMSDFLDPSRIPSIFWRLPFVGNLSISLSFEGHPSANINLTADRKNINKIREAFVPGGELNIFSWGFRVSGYSEKPVKNSPATNREYDISITLGGKWENYTNKICYLRQRSISNRFISLGGGLEKCVARYQLSSGYTDSNGTIATVTVNELAKRVNVPLYGSLLPVNIAKDTPANTTVNWSSLLDERKRISGYYVDYSKYKGVYCKFVKSGKKWTLRDNDLIEYNGLSINAIRFNPFYVPPLNLTISPIKISNLPTTIQSPTPISNIVDENTSIIPNAEEFRNVQLTGNFAYRLNGLESRKDGILSRSSKSLVEGLNTSRFAVITTVSFTNSNQIEDSEQQKQQQPPKWKRRTPVISVLTQGDKNPLLPPIGTLEELFPREQYHLSLNHDSSGPTKTYTISTSEDGVPISEETFTYGFAFTASQIGGVNEDTAELISPTSQAGTWQLVDYSKTTYIYDYGTGYALGSDTVGWKLTRFQQESDNEPETIFTAQKLRELNDFIANEGPFSEDEQLENEILKEEYTGEIKSRQFFVLAKRSATRYLLKSFKGIYADSSQEQSPYETYQVCTPSGTAQTRYVLDPNYVDPMYIAAESSESISFAFMTAPNYRQLKLEHDERNEERSDNGLPLLTFVPPPPYVTGEETYMRRTIEIVPKKIIKPTDTFSKLTPSASFQENDMYVEYTSEFNSLDANFKSSLQNTRFSEKEGRPGVASRKPNQFEKEEPENEEEKKNKVSTLTANAGELKIMLATPGYETYPESGNVSYDIARNYDEALNAATTDLYIGNVTGTLSSSITIPFNPDMEVWDKIDLYCEGILYRRRITAITHNFEFNGLDSNGIPLVNAVTNLTLGLDRDVDYKVSNVTVPTPGDNTRDNPDLNKPPKNPTGFWELGEILPLSLKSRLNLRKG